MQDQREGFLVTLSVYFYSSLREGLWKFYIVAGIYFGVSKWLIAVCHVVEV